MIMSVIVLFLEGVSYYEKKQDHGYVAYDGDERHFSERLFF